jgi:uncharacterized protein
MTSVIDFRARPPISEYRNLFTLKLGRLEWKNRYENPVVKAVAPSMRKVGTPESLQLFKDEMKAAHIETVVIPGRNVQRSSKAANNVTQGGPLRIGDDRLLELQKDFDGSAVGLHAINLSAPIADIVAGVERAVRVHKMPGVVAEPGLFPDDDGKYEPIDSKRFYPAYETLVAADAFLMIMTGIYAGPDIGANDMEPVDRLLQDFPTLKVVLAHGGYPRIIDAMALAAKHPNLYLSPDVYNWFPGGRLYVESIPLLPDQFIFASAYPFGPLQESVDLTLQFPLTATVMDNYLTGNAARLLRRT